MKDKLYWERVCWWLSRWKWAYKISIGTTDNLGEILIEMK